MRVTIKEVAAEAGVSYQVVSAVLGNCSYARASKETRKKVHEAAEKLGYVPNISARILQGRSSGMIGVLIDPLASQTTFSILFELEKAASRRNCRLLIFEAHDNPARLKEACSEMRQYSVDGVIALAHTYPGIGSVLDDFDDSLAVVPVQDILPGKYPAVVNDTAAGIAAAARHLIDSGYRNIVMLTSADLGYPSSQQRVEGFREILPGNSIFYLRKTDDAEKMAAELKELIPEILSHKADAIVCYNDLTAAAVIRELRANNVQVPEDVGVTGFDDAPFCSVLDPPLTSIAPDFTAMAENVFKLLEQRIAGNRENVFTAVPPFLKIRKSSQKNSH